METGSTNLGNTTIFYGPRTSSGSSAGEQTRFIMQDFGKELERTNKSFDDVAYTSIILRDMADFTGVNPVYGSYFTKPNPPARATIACADALPDGIDVMLSFTVQSASADSAEPRKGLHVQSRSYWAPANIGPYSQAISAPGDDVVYIAGQIPLVPASMELVRSETGNDFDLQAVLSLQHLDRIGRAVDVKGWVAAIAFIVCQGGANADTAIRARNAWESFHRQECGGEDEHDGDEAGDFDVWNMTHGSGRTSFWTPSSRSAVRRPDREHDAPPLWIISVDALPRGASIEWVAYGTTKDSGQDTHIQHLDYLLSAFRGRLL
jgi:diphthine-ammonia ligase